MKKQNYMPRFGRWELFLGVMVFLCLPLSSLHAEKLMVPLGKSITLPVSTVTKILAVKEGVVDVLNVSDDEIIISGLGEKPATTQIILWDSAGKKIYDIETYGETDLLTAKFNALVGDPGITLVLLPDVAYLKGSVYAQEKSKTAEDILKKLVVDRPIINLVEVKQPIQEITLEQRIGDAIKIPTVKVTIVSPNDPKAAAAVAAGQAGVATAPASMKNQRVVLEGFVKDQNEFIRMMEIVRGFVDDEKNISNLVTIDKPVQVVFQAYVLQVNKKNVRDLGVEWGGSDSLGGALTQGTLRYFENISNVFRGDVAAEGAPIDKWPNPLKMNNINRFDIIAARVKAWEEASKVKVLANPKLIVYANASPLKIAKTGWTGEKDTSEAEDTIVKDSGIAYVTVGQETLFTSKFDTQGNPSYEKANAELKLMIRDLYTKNDDIKFSVFVKQDEPSFSRGTSAPPDILKRSVMTTVKVPNGETIVLGGLINNSKSVTDNGVPFFSKLPGLGRFFRWKSYNNSENELIVLLTPEIMGQAPSPIGKKKFEVVPVPRRSDRLEELHNIFQTIKKTNFPDQSK